MWHNFITHITTQVSTHSRPKAAGPVIGVGGDLQGIGFNTQPPEGGWSRNVAKAELIQVSTHSRPKAAGPASNCAFQARHVSTHSRPKAAGNPQTHARFRRFRFNTQPPEGGWRRAAASAMATYSAFQHTAARRRLAAAQ